MIASIPSALLFQTANMERFLSGGCDSADISLNQLLSFGNFGIGHFNGPNSGELIIASGLAYYFPELEKSVPIDDFSIKPHFATVTRFQPERSVFVRDIPDYTAFSSQLDKNLRNLSRNYAVLLKGDFSHLTFHPCTERADRSDPVTYRNVYGMLIGFRIAKDMPPAIHQPGYHFHGMSTPGVGGHILDLGIIKAQADIQPLGNLEIMNTTKPRRRPGF